METGSGGGRLSTIVLYSVEASCAVFALFQLFEEATGSAKSKNLAYAAVGICGLIILELVRTAQTQRAAIKNQHKILSVIRADISTLGDTIQTIERYPTLHAVLMELGQVYDWAHLQNLDHPYLDDAIHRGIIQRISELREITAKFNLTFDKCSEGKRVSELRELLRFSGTYIAVSYDLDDYIAEFWNTVSGDEYMLAHTKGKAVSRVFVLSAETLAGYNIDTIAIVVKIAEEHSRRKIPIKIVSAAGLPKRLLNDCKSFVVADSKIVSESYRLEEPHLDGCIRIGSVQEIETLQKIFVDLNQRPGITLQRLRALRNLEERR